MPETLPMVAILSVLPNIGTSCTLIIPLHISCDMPDTLPILNLGLVAFALSDTTRISLLYRIIRLSVAYGGNVGIEAK
jgi:hypothetical protein